MAHGHGRHHSHLVPAEKIIFRFIVGVPIVYFLAVFFIKGYHEGVFTVATFHKGILPALGHLLSDTWLNWIAPLFIIADAFLLFVLIYSTAKVWHIRGRLSITDPPTHSHGPAHGGDTVKPKKNPAILKYWTAIIKKANTGTPENLRSAVLEADALVDFFLKQAGYAGEHMADRLGQISRTGVKSVEKAWETHRLRNDIAHTPGFVVSSKRAEQALLAVRDFLKEMQAF